MKNTKEIKALFHLLDDPDKEIFDTVSDKLVHFGKEIIPNLEHYWEQTNDNIIQERIEDIIHKLNYNDTYEEIKNWYHAEKPDLLGGALLLSKYRFPAMKEDDCRKTLKSLYQSCWLELHNYLTPLEQINIINSVFYNMYKFNGFDLEVNNANHYFISEVLETRQGNNYSLGTIYQLLCEMLDIPVFAIQLPRQHLLAYFDTTYNFFDKEEQQRQKIQFYIDANSGSIFTQNDVDMYLKKYNFAEVDSIYKPLSNQEIILTTIESLIMMYDELNQVNHSTELSNIVALRGSK
jgi:regulator of sirC expression with transglutaminase-like and TPR domain